MLLRATEKDQNWNLNFGGIALMWRGGCIIRSVFLGNIKDAFDKNPNLANLLLDDFFSSALNKYQAGPGARPSSTPSKSASPLPAFSTALAFYDGYPHRAAPRQPPAGPARLLRRAHLRARRQAARPVLPHQLDRPRRTRLLVNLQRLTTNDPAMAAAAPVQSWELTMSPSHRPRLWTVAAALLLLAAAGAWAANRCQLQAQSQASPAAGSAPLPPGTHRGWDACRCALSH